MLTNDHYPDSFLGATKHLYLGVCPSDRPLRFFYQPSCRCFAASDAVFQAMFSHAWWHYKPVTNFTEGNKSEMANICIESFSKTYEMCDFACMGALLQVRSVYEKRERAVKFHGVLS